ncbi:MAG TPA: LPS export ABC transporter permease LptF [Terriglobales bacterium]|nr:LPS export ABC transporter permease LptF [Terriglobales bacterium]
MLKVFDRYVLKEVVPPFFAGLLVTTFVLLMNQVLILAELLIDKGVPAGLAARLFVLLVPSLLAFAVPMAVLAGILGGLARLSADSEVAAFATLGVGPRRFVRPLLAFGVAGWLLASALTLVLAPRANFRWVQAMTGSVLARAGLRVNPMEFNETIPGVVLYVQNVDREKGWENVFAYLGKDSRAPRVVMARAGRLELYPEQKRATLELRDGVIHSGDPAESSTYSVTAFDRFEEEIDVENLFPPVTSEKRVREKDIVELLRDVRVIRGELAGLEGKRLRAPGSQAAVLLAGQKLREFRAHLVEIHKKFALPFACLVFVLLGLPLGLAAGRSGRTGGLSLSLGVILLYYVLITTGEKLAMDGKLAPWLAMWGPDLLLAVAAIALIFRTESASAVLSRLAGALRRLEHRAGPPQPRRRAFRAPRLPLRFPNILDRYLSRRYLAVLSLSLAWLLAAAALAAFFERLDILHRHGKPLGLLLRHVWFRVPEFLTAVLPVAALATALLVVGVLVRTNEATALKASGISLYRAVLPVLVMAAAVSGAAFLVEERLAPAAGLRAEETWNRIIDRPGRKYSTLNRHWIVGRRGDRVYHYEFSDPGSSAFSRLSVFDLDTAAWSLAARAYAETGVLVPGGVELRRGWTRDFRRGAALPFALRDAWVLAAGESRGWFVREGKEPEQMTYGELRRYASEVRAMGFEATRYRVDLAAKVAFPLAALIMTLLAVPLGFTMGRKGTLVGVGLSVALAFGYWGTFAIFRSLGYTGVLPPFLAAWAADLMFGLAGVLLLFRLRT